MRLYLRVVLCLVSLPLFIFKVFFLFVWRCLSSAFALQHKINSGGYRKSHIIKLSSVIKYQLFIPFFFVHFGSEGRSPDEKYVKAYKYVCLVFSYYPVCKPYSAVFLVQHFFIFSSEQNIIFSLFFSTKSSFPTKNTMNFVHFTSGNQQTPNLVHFSRLLGVPM